MEVRKNCELLEVSYNETNEKVELLFLDDERGEVLTVNFNKQVYDNGSWRKDKEKAQKVEKWCEEYFQTCFDKLSDCVGVKKDIYTYEKFNSLWESEQINKFKVEDKGRIFQTTIKEIKDDVVGIHVIFDYKGEDYESRMTHSKYSEALKRYLLDPLAKKRRRKEFKELFGVDFEDRQELIGKEIQVEIKVAFGKYAYGEIKKPSWS